METSLIFLYINDLVFRLKKFNKNDIIKVKFQSLGDYMWNYEIKKKIDYILDGHSNNNDYAVFDCDNTILMNDIAFAFLQYVLKFKKFNIRAKEYYQELLKIFPNEKIILNKFYEILEKSENRKIDSEEYLNFLASYEYFMEYFFKKYKFDITTFLFQGYKYEDIITLVNEAINFHKKQDFCLEVFEYEDRKSIYRLGIKIVDEMEQLIKDLYEKNIDVYVISGSLTIIVKIVLKPLEKYIKNIWGRELEIKNGYYTGHIEKDSIYTMGEGKCLIIDSYLLTKYKKGPVLVAGDSMGDYNMLSKYDDTKLSILIDRNRPKEFLALADICKKRYLIQRVDERKGIFINREKSITLGDDNE